MKVHNSIRLFLVLLFTGLFISCASNKYPQKKRKRCNDCPRFSQQLPENSNYDNVKDYDPIG